MPEKRERYQNRIELLQGTLDLLILQTLQCGPQHGYGISVARPAVSARSAGPASPAIIRSGSGTVLFSLASRCSPLIDLVSHNASMRRLPPRLSQDSSVQL